MGRRGQDVTRQRRISMTTRKELIEAVGARYRGAATIEKKTMLDEFVALTGYHRKHATRVLGAAPPSERKAPVRERIYDEAVRQALLVLWEAGDRICGKRLKPLIPVLITAMEGHGHLELDALVKARLLQISAATIDRSLSNARAHIGGKRRRGTGVGAAIRRSVPVRTFCDWRDPPPGFLEVDMVEHCGGPKTDGDFVHTLTLTDIASGWTECVAMPLRNQSLVVEALDVAGKDLPFAMLGIDTDNDSAFMNQTVFDYCKAKDLEQTRSRAYKKNDQAWVEQKNGAIVRRLVGYGRLSGLAATRALAQLYGASRLYINFFQPSFKLKAKTRDGARVIKTYHAPATPCDRLLASTVVSEKIKSRLREQFERLDPVSLLCDIRVAQRTLSEMTARGPRDATVSTSESPTVATYLQGLATAWKDGEVRPTHRRKATQTRWWRTRADPFEHAWPVIEDWLVAEPTATAKQLMNRLAQVVPDAYASKAQLRTLQRRIKAWRAEKAKDLILGKLRQETREDAEV
ncbi:MAG: integrase catalytic domain-containing protein [Methyloceanibacter sp.]